MTTEMKRLEVFIDGCCEPVNPGGTAAYGVVVKCEGKVLFSEGKIVGSGNGISNNVAEYSGLLAFLEWMAAKYPDLESVFALVHSDSKLLVYQMNGRWQAKQGAYIPYYRKCEEYIRIKGMRIGFTWVPREQNQEADDVSKAPLKAAGVKFRIQPD